MSADHPRQPWRDIAAALDLEAEAEAEGGDGGERWPTLGGQWRDRAVTVQLLRSGRSRYKGRSTEVAVTAAASWPAGLDVQHETSQLRVGEALGIGDLRLGDPELDRLVKVRAPDPFEARSILLAGNVRDVLVDLFGRHDDLELRGGVARLEKLGVVPDADVLRSWLDDLSYLLDALEAAAVGQTYEFPADHDGLPHTGEVRTARPPRRPTEAQTREVRAVVEYRRRQTIGVMAGLVPAVGGFGLMGAGSLYAAEPMGGLTGAWWAGIGFVALVVGGLVFYLAWRCPVCGRWPLAHGQREVTLAPPNCPHCGARLA